MSNVNQSGMALVLAMIFLVLLTSIGLMLIDQSVTGIKVSSGLRDYDKAFNLADGAGQMSMQYLISRATLDSSDPYANNTATVAGLSGTYMDQTHNLSSGSSYRPGALWMGYDSSPTPGWMLNWQGASKFHKVNLSARGTGSVTTRESNSSVESLMVKIQR